MYNLVHRIYNKELLKSMTTYTSYRALRPSNLCSPQYRHVLLLLYWPVYGFVFWFAEQVWEPETFHTMYCLLDDRIPFFEWFVIPYLYWFVFLIGTLAYCMVFDVPAFRQMMHFVIVTYSLSLVIFFLFPNCQQLRPEQFPRDNILTRFMAGFYAFDTNTNVFPSLHVVGSMAALAAAWRAKGLNKPLWRAVSLVSAVLISLSTVFLKQHSVLDIFGGLAVSGIGYLLCFRSKK